METRQVLNTLFIELKYAQKRSPLLAERIFDEIFEMLYQKCCSVASFYLYEKEYAEEVALESLAKIYRSIKKYNPNYNAYNWIYTTVKHVAFNYNKQLLRRYSEVELTEKYPDIHITADKLSVRIDIQNAIEKLCEPQKTYIVEYYFEDYTLDEIGEKYGINKSTVYHHIQKASNALRNHLEDYQTKCV